MLLSSGFDPGKLLQHFQDHGPEFGAATEVEYEELADRFLAGPRGLGTLECARVRGDIVRFNPTTDEFGVISSDGIIRTYFKPDPLIHRQATNLDYYRAECRK